MTKVPTQPRAVRMQSKPKYSVATEGVVTRGSARQLDVSRLLTSRGLAAHL
jgi:hypothetical protein